MAGPTMIAPMQSDTSPSPSTSAANFQPPHRHQFTPHGQFDHGSGHTPGHTTFHRPRHHKFQPRFPPSGGGDDAMGASFDGKRMRKAIHRKTVDYNPSVFKYLQNRIWQRDRRDEHLIQPDPLYIPDLLPPSALIEKPMNCVTTRFVRTSTNKFRCPIFCLSWTPEGRRLVTGASSGEFTLWNGLTFNFETILQAHETAVRAMRWSHSDAWMVTADHAGYIKYWQSNMNNVRMYPGHKEPVRGIRWAVGRIGRRKKEEKKRYDTVPEGETSPYQAHPQVVDRGPTARYRGQLGISHKLSRTNRFPGALPMGHGWLKAKGVDPDRKPQGQVGGLGGSPTIYIGYSGLIACLPKHY